MHTCDTASAQNVGRRAADTRPTWHGLRTGQRVAAGHGSRRVHRGGRVWDGAPAGPPTVVPHPAGGRMDSPATKAQRSARALISSRVAAYQDAHRPSTSFQKPNCMVFVLVFAGVLSAASHAPLSNGQKTCVRPSRLIVTLIS